MSTTPAPAPWPLCSKCGRAPEAQCPSFYEIHKRCAHCNACVRKADGGLRSCNPGARRRRSIRP